MLVKRRRYTKKKPTVEVVELDSEDSELVVVTVLVRMSRVRLGYRTGDQSGDQSRG
jgi:hypothetical protein